MDLSGLEDLIPPLAQALGVEPASALLFLGVAVTACNLAGRLIPDDATGVLGGVRKVCKAVGLFFPNRISSGVSVDDVAKAVVTRKVSSVADSLETEAKAELREQVSKVLPGVSKD